MATTSIATVPAAPEPVMDFLKIPDWLLVHPELRKRGIVVHRPIQPFTVYQTNCLDDAPVYVVKAIKPSRPEADIYELLDQHSGSPTNHTVPHEIIRCDRPLVVMPFASEIQKIFTKKLSSVLAAFDQILEGVEHMHRLRIAHGDIFIRNVVAATEEDASYDARLTAGRVYLIDFETSQQFEHCPGVQTAVPLPHTHVVPPLKMKTFDPFSWDVYCLGATLEVMVMRMYWTRPEYKPWITRLLVRWLKGDEASCTSVCRCRPTVTRARKVLAIVRWIVVVGELLITIFTYPTTIFRTPEVDYSHE